MKNLVVGDGVEEVVVARVEHGVAHAAEDSKHGSTAVLDLNVEGTVTGINILDLSRVASRDERRGAVVASRKVLGSSGVLAGGHGDSLGKEAEEGDLFQGRPVRVMNRDRWKFVMRSLLTWTSPKVGTLARAAKPMPSSRTEEKGTSPAKSRDPGKNAMEDEYSSIEPIVTHHGNTSVLDLNGTTAGERVRVLNEAEGIEKIEGSGVDTKAVGGASISSDGGVDASLLNGAKAAAEGGGGADKGKGDGRLHFDVLIVDPKGLWEHGIFLSIDLRSEDLPEKIVSSWFNLNQIPPIEFKKDPFQPESQLTQAEKDRSLLIVNLGLGFASSWQSQQTQLKILALHPALEGQRRQLEGGRSEDLYVCPQGPNVAGCELGVHNRRTTGVSSSGALSALRQSQDREKPLPDDPFNLSVEQIRHVYHESEYRLLAKQQNHNE
ncbi:hypothetical protein THAOC_10347 [Thalassiosira oceanica]|uniref:Uncharacterized protein n=1 Tax=Thalassiosira oceanica TaxID=159749 RepID=K0SQ82_THAOC|nr:hypothetical protein THAOC_10347 [Thalassiosira oceanica]|eukprot:EJK68468.1 hypothetical protein THAOC_10347 [Thalassiosira oceanica]